MEEKDAPKSDPKTLAAMLRAGGTSRLWQPAELSAIMRHQLSAPIQFDLASLNPKEAASLRSLSESEGLLVRSFADLLLHPNPPAELLRMTKDFAKACSTHPDRPLPNEVCTLLYFASIATALVRCGQRISDLDDIAILSGFRWLAAQTWLDPRLLTLLHDATERLSPTEAPNHE